MNENEKIELFDKWYDENYDEWAEGEEGIALREELEQAFKGGIAELEKKNADLKEEINKIAFARGNLEEENAELKLKLEVLEGQTPWKVIKDKSEVIGQLTKAKEIIKNLMAFAEMDDREYEKEYKEAEQFLKD